MNSCNFLCQAFANIHWLWFIVAVLVAFAIGAIWYSLLFSKIWIRVFKVDIPEKMSRQSMTSGMVFQLAATALLGLVFFILTSISAWLAILTLVSFCGWRKSALKFQFANWKTFIQAAIVDVGYLFIVGIVFILFALIK